MKKFRGIFFLVLLAAYLIAYVILSIMTAKDERAEKEFRELKPMHSSSADMNLCNSLEELETKADLIVEGIVRKRLEQTAPGRYDAYFQKMVPTSGYTKHRIEVTKVYKGDVAIEDKLIVHQAYFVWEYEDGEKQLICHSNLDPFMPGDCFLFFLKYSEEKESYYLISDYQGAYPMEKATADATIARGLVVEDLTHYKSYDGWYLLPIYDEVLRKYFGRVEPPKPELYQVETEWETYSDYESLYEAADAVVIGTFTGSFLGDASQELTYSGSESGEGTPVDAVSNNGLYVEKVLKKPDTMEEFPEYITMLQNYGIEVEKNRLVSFSYLKPMEKGDRWIFFLKQDAQDTFCYRIVGDSSGRFPVPDEELLAVVEKAVQGQAYEAELTAEQFGVNDAEKINIELYRDVIRNLDCTLESER